MDNGLDCRFGPGDWPEPGGAARRVADAEKSGTAARFALVFGIFPDRADGSPALLGLLPGAGAFSRR